MDKNLLLTLLICISISVHAADVDSTRCTPGFELEYTTELQTNFDKSRWANLLQLRAQLPLSRKLAFDISTISIASTNEASLALDFQGYSSIYAENLPLALSVACAEWNIDDHNTLYAGIRRMDEDYFCSNCFSLFTNSSCGALPTISLNSDIAVYPNAAVGLHYHYEKAALSVDASIYNGRGYRRFTGRENVFRFCPQSDGVFTLAQVEYRQRDNFYFLGASARYGDRLELEIDDETYSFSSRKKTFVPTAWAHMEQSLSRNFILIAAYSHAFGPDVMCRNFAALGGKYTFCNVEMGLFTDYIRFLGMNEFATELTFCIPLNRYVSLQPTVHFISTDGNAKCIGMFRMNVTI